MNVQGTIYKVGEVQQISEKFKKREIVIKTEGDYPQFIGCQLTQDKCSLGSFLNVGDEVDASINLRGREWISPKDGVVKYFNTIEIWKLETIGIPRNNQGIPDATDGITKNFQEDAIQTTTNQSDDLPF
tara:strand:+ start:273 stop:659 length:387 start_codon:yes stop_codon:yes gene_type:complete